MLTEEAAQRAAAQLLNQARAASGSSIEDRHRDEVYTRIYAAFHTGDQEKRLKHVSLTWVRSLVVEYCQRNAPDFSIVEETTAPLPAAKVQPLPTEVPEHEEPTIGQLLLAIEHLELPRPIAAKEKTKHKSDARRKILKATQLVIFLLSIKGQSEDTIQHTIRGAKEKGPSNSTIVKANADIKAELLRIIQEKQIPRLSIVSAIIHYLTKRNDWSSTQLDGSGQLSQAAGRVSKISAKSAPTVFSTSQVATAWAIAISTILLLVLQLCGPSRTPTQTWNDADDVVTSTYKGHKPIQIATEAPDSSGHDSTEQDATSALSLTQWLKSLLTGKNGMPVLQQDEVALVAFLEGDGARPFVSIFKNAGLFKGCFVLGSTDGPSRTDVGKRSCKHMLREHTVLATWEEIEGGVEVGQAFEAVWDIQGGPTQRSGKAVVIPHSTVVKPEFRLEWTDVAKYFVHDDTDGISNWFEDGFGTTTTKDDTDGDEISDKVELTFYRSDPLNADTDGDGMNDTQEASGTSGDLSPGDTVMRLLIRDSGGRTYNPNSRCDGRHEVYEYKAHDPEVGITLYFNSLDPDLAKHPPSRFGAQGVESLGIAYYTAKLPAPTLPYLKSDTPLLIQSDPGRQWSYIFATGLILPIEGMTLESLGGILSYGWACSNLNGISTNEALDDFIYGRTHCPESGPNSLSTPQSWLAAGAVSREFPPSKQKIYSIEQVTAVPLPTGVAPLLLWERPDQQGNKLNVRRLALSSRADTLAGEGWIPTAIIGHAWDNCGSAP